MSLYGRDPIDAEVVEGLRRSRARRAEVWVARRTRRAERGYITVGLALFVACIYMAVGWWYPL